MIKEPLIRWFTDLGMNDVPLVGGKNASLGEMISQLSDAGISVPGGFATTASAFTRFLEINHLDTKINQRLSALDVEDVTELAKAGAQIRAWISEAPLPQDLEADIRAHYRELGETVAVAVRSSATAEDLPEASFAGQQESFLNVRGIDQVLRAEIGRAHV